MGPPSTSPPPGPGPRPGIPDERFVEQMVRCQLRLKAYLRSVIPDWSRADDVLQETNLVLWRKAAEFRPGTDFQAWALKIAHFQVMAHRLKNRRQRLCFDESVVEQLSDTAMTCSDEGQRRLEAMRACVRRLPPRQRDILYSRYSVGSDSPAIARQMSSTAKAIRVTLHRIRVALLECINRRLEAENP